MGKKYIWLVAVSAYLSVGAIVFALEFSTTRSQPLNLFFAALFSALAAVCGIWYFKASRQGIKSTTLIMAMLLALLSVGAYWDHFLVYQPEPTFLKIVATGEKNQESKGSEVWISSIEADGVEQDLTQVTDAGWELRENNLVSYQHQPTSLFYTTEDVRHVNITFGAHDWSGIVQIYNGESMEKIDLYSVREQGPYLYQYEAPVQITYPKMVFPIVCMGVGAFFLFLLLFSLWAEELRTAAASFYAAAIGVTVALLLVNSFYFVSWDFLSKIVVVFSFGYGFYRASNYQQNIGAKVLFPSKKSIVVYGLIVMYATLACMYNQIIISPHDIRLGIQGVCVLLFVFGSGFVLSFSVLANMSRLQAWMKTRLKVHKAQPITKLWTLLFLIVAGVWSIWLIACFPANLSPDSVAQWKQVIGVDPLYNWHPVFHTALIWLFSLIYQSPAIPALAQLLVGAAIWATGAIFLYRSGVPRKLVIGVTILVALSPNNAVYSVTLWKDVSYAIALLALTICLARVVKHQELQIKNMLLLGIAICFVAMVRHNGIAPAIVVTLALFFVLKGWRKTVPIIALSLMLITQTLVYNRIGVIPAPENLKLVPPLHGLGAVLYYDGELDDESIELLTKDVPKEVWDKQFHPYLADPYLYTESPKVGDLLDTLDTGTVLKLYSKALVFNPGLIIHERLTDADINWAVFHPASEEAFNHRFGFGVYPDNPYVSAQPNILTTFAEKGLNMTIQISILDTVLWRGGWIIILLFLMLYHMWIQKRIKYGLVLLPFFANFFALFFGISSQDYRYVYSLYLCFPFLFLLYSTALCEE